MTLEVLLQPELSDSHCGLNSFPALASLTKKMPSSPSGSQRLVQLLAQCMCLVAESWLTLFDPMNCRPPGSSVHGDSPGKNTGMGCHALLQGIFSTQGSNQRLMCLLYGRQILYHWDTEEAHVFPSEMIIYVGGCLFVNSLFWLFTWK